MELDLLEGLDLVEHADLVRKREVREGVNPRGLAYDGRVGNDKDQQMGPPIDKDHQTTPITRRDPDGTVFSLIILFPNGPGKQTSEETSTEPSLNLQTSAAEPLARHGCNRTPLSRVSRTCCETSSWAGLTILGQTPVPGPIPFVMYHDCVDNGGTGDLKQRFPVRPLYFYLALA